MNILFISPNSPYDSVGGIERYISNLINFYKSKLNCQMFVLLPTSGKSRTEKIGNVSIFFDSNFLIPRNAAHYQKEISLNARRFATLVDNIIKDEKIDIVCAENIMFGPPAVYSLFLSMATASKKIPLILRLHSFATTSLQIELINQLMWKKISCVSQSVAGDCYQKGADVDILSTHYLGVNTFEFDDNYSYENGLRKHLVVNDHAKIILTATRIVRGEKSIIQEKGLVNLIKAFSKISPRYPNLYLLIAVGSAPENLKDEFANAYQMLLGYIKLHSIGKNTIVKTFKMEEMPQVYRESDLFVLPSENETFGQVFIEAMSCGTPVIGTKVGGIPEIISDSYNGYLVQPNDASILAQRIEKLLNDKEVRTSFKNAGVKTVKNTFTSESQFANFHKMLEEIAANK